MQPHIVKEKVKQVKIASIPKRDELPALKTLVDDSCVVSKKTVF